MSWAGEAAGRDQGEPRGIVLPTALGAGGREDATPPPAPVQGHLTLYV